MTPLSCSTRIGRKARVPLTTPSKLICRSHSSSPGSASRTEDATATPALLNTAASRAPWASEASHWRTSAAKRGWAAASRTSSTLVSTAPRSALAVSFRPVSSTSAMATGAPDRDSRRARLRPMPEAAPVIIAGLPAMILRFLAIGAPYRGGVDPVSGDGGPAVHHGPAALGRAVRHTARVPAFAAFTRRFQREVAEQGPQHHVHLHVGEGGADASPGPAAERDPLVGVRPAADEAVRAERARSAEQRLIAVHQVGADPNDLSLRVPGCFQLIPSAVPPVGEPSQHDRMPAQPLDRPGQCGRRGLVAGGQQ